jgi:RNase H-fold protein (predicted Holliday junction resolvase)
LIGELVLGIDPGTRKAGYAVTDPSGRALELGIEPVGSLLARLELLVGSHRIAAVALGRGTNALPVRDQISALGIPVHLIDETETTLRARVLYFADHPPRGWRRLIPLGLQLPPRPIDDYAALLIARRYIERGAGDPASYL